VTLDTAKNCHRSATYGECGFYILTAPRSALPVKNFLQLFFPLNVRCFPPNAVKHPNLQGRPAQLRGIAGACCIVFTRDGAIRAVPYAEIV
jgi:hypothetical protein